jgi:hypothetical protein
LVDSVLHQMFFNSIAFKNEFHDEEVGYNQDQIYNI